MPREAELEKKVQAILESAIAEGELPCANVMVLHRDQVICYTQAGRDPGTGEEISRDTIFRLYSQTKPVTSAAVCLLMERGIIDMNDPVEKYLPGFANPKVLQPDGEMVPAERPVKLMDLMGMCAGLCYPMEDAPGQYAARLFDDNQAAMDEGKPGLTTVEFANEIGKLPLAFQPGTAFRYSTCADVLGAVVEVASGKRYGDFLREEIFEPLEMPDTGFCLPEEKLPRLVTCAKRTPEGIQVMECRHLNVGNYTREPAFASGGAGLVSTLEDLRSAFGPDRSISLCRELTKLHEEVVRTTLEEAVEKYTENPPKGEFVLVVAGAEPEEKETASETDAASHVAALMARGLSRKDAIKQTAKDLDLPKNVVYDAALKIEE